MRFAASFIGSPPVNLLNGKLQRRDGGLFFVECVESNALTLPLRGRLEALADKHVDKEVVFGIRPEHISNAPNANRSTTPVTLTVEIAEPMGSESLVYMKTGSGNLIARIQGDHIFHLGEQVTAQFDLDRVTLLIRKRKYPLMGH